MKVNLLVAVLSLSIASLASTTTASADTNDTNFVNEVVFPSPESSYLDSAMRYEVTDILKVGIGVSKNGVRNALGNPHFREFSGKTWDYMVSLRKANSSDYIDCQLQIGFDKNDKVKTTTWMGECPSIVKNYQ